MPVSADERVVKEFCAYYELYQKYKNDYRAEEILSGTVSEQAKDKARKADFDERLSLMGMLIDKLRQEIRDNILDSDILNEIMGPLRALKKKAAEEERTDDLLTLLSQQREGRQKAMDSLQKAGALSARDKKKSREVVRFLSAGEKMLRTADKADAKEAFLLLEGLFQEEVAAYRQRTQNVQKKLHFLFQFVEDTFGSGNEMLLLMTECTVQEDCAKFISLYGSEDYRRHNEELMLTERGDELLTKIEALEL